MYIVIPGTTNLRSVLSLIEGLRVYWSQRGTAIHATDFMKTAKEVALAANYLLNNHLPKDLRSEEVVPADLIDSIIGYVFRRGGRGAWSRVFTKRTDEEIVNWEKSGINYITLVYNIWDDEYETGFKRQKIPHMVVRFDKEDPLPSEADLTQDWVERNVERVVNMFRERQSIGFLESGE